MSCDLSMAHARQITVSVCVPDLGLSTMMLKPDYQNWRCGRLTTLPFSGLCHLVSGGDSLFVTPGYRWGHPRRMPRASSPT